ncbi:MAG: Tat-linked quality control protein TatD [Firmicutes bacterium ADurb.Bin300]|jgi:TatD DNase family protein|nr:MAG: Tat-linked quality control protein TatD [Firmicutes bacterium ADurb.Bin300]
MKNIFDTHTHYTDNAFDEDRHELLASLPETGICGVINCGTDIRDSETSLALAHKYPYIYAAVGIHPHEAAKSNSSFLSFMRCFIEDEKVVALGEIGLDYHYDFSPRDVQKQIFRQQLELAKEYDLPVIIHDREAHSDTLAILNEFKPKGVLHCFSGSVEFARDALSLGLYIGLGGAVTFKNAKRPLEVASFVPSDMLLLETDCPYMTPHPHRGKRCDSSFITITAQKLAEVRGTDVRQILNQTADNARKLFNIKEQSNEKPK